MFATLCRSQGRVGSLSQDQAPRRASAAVGRACAEPGRGDRANSRPAVTGRCGHPASALSAATMPDRSLRAVRSDDLMAEVGARLPLFDDLSPDTIQRLSAEGFGRGLLTASLRARLRKAGFPDLGHLAQSSPVAIAAIRKFGPVRVERVRHFILDTLARWLPRARETHTPEATRARRLDRLRGLSAGCLPLAAGQIAALRFEDGSCADIATCSRLWLLRTGAVTSDDVDHVVAALTRLARASDPGPPRPLEEAGAAPAGDAAAMATRRAALLAERDREWDEAAPTEGRHRT